MSEAVWQELLHFESRDLVSDLYRRTREAISSWKAYVIVAALSQGRAYFRSAKGVPTTL